MRSVVAVHPHFDGVWPYAADKFAELLAHDGDVTFIRLDNDNEEPLHTLLDHPETVTRLVSLRVNVTLQCVQAFRTLEEAYIVGTDYSSQDDPLNQHLRERGVQTYSHPSEGYWGQSVSEFALALTLCGLRRIPQSHHAMISSLEPWNHTPPDGVGQPNARGQQFGDDPRFANGTIEGKRVRIIGAGNIASRYASFVKMLGADVAAWDPFAPEPSFHRAGARKEWHLERLLQDADIFAPLVPLTEKTQGLVTSEFIRMLPRGTLVVLATRAGICDMPELRRRVLADELSLAADVFDIEPLPLADPLLGRHNVVHTPHNAGRTKEANYAYAGKIVEQFRPR